MFCNLCREVDHSCWNNFNVAVYSEGKDVKDGNLEDLRCLFSCGRVYPNINCVIIDIEPAY